MAHHQRETRNTTNGVLLCSLVQVARVVIVREAMQGRQRYLEVMVDVLIGHR